MKKDRYVYPEVSMDFMEIRAALLTESTDLNESSSLESFEDDGNLIVW
ncbi:MAG: hypothetical protein IKH11_06730 [Bacteroidales bacterium]|nr:hypothetical protein [Bacteroidales bacterium]